jgi:hypothetical protein
MKMERVELHQWGQWLEPQAHLKIFVANRVMNQCLENDKKSMNNSPLRGGNLLLQYIQCTR